MLLTVILLLGSVRLRLLIVLFFREPVFQVVFDTNVQVELG